MMCLPRRLISGLACLCVLATAAGGQNGTIDLEAATLQLAQVKGTFGDSKISGSFAPMGPPIGIPVRVDAGGHCIVDLTQGYIVSGSLSGSFQIDYRIITYGPCPAGPPAPGTYYEEWIAHGALTGTLDGVAASASFSYTALVRVGGDVRGRIVLGNGLAGELVVRGNFADGELSYKGRAK